MNQSEIRFKLDTKCIKMHVAVYLYHVALVYSRAHDLVSSIHVTQCCFALVKSTASGRYNIQFFAVGANAEFCYALKAAVGNLVHNCKPQRRICVSKEPECRHCGLARWAVCSIFLRVDRSINKIKLCFLFSQLLYKTSHIICKKSTFFLRKSALIQSRMIKK